MSILPVKMMKNFYFVGDLARAQFAVATPLVEESQKHAIRPEFVLLA
jgi:hypothetical protein